MEFRAALKKGLGRAMLLLREAPGDKDYNNALIDACRVNQVYDPQCEEDRVAYLYQLICNTQNINFYSRTLLHFISDEGKTIDAIDKVQVFGIICLIAKNDDEFDRSILRNFLLSTDSDAISSGCMDKFIELEGFEGLLLCVHQFHSKLVENSFEGCWMFQSLLVDALIARDGVEAAMAALQNARSDCPELDELMSLNEQARQHAPQVEEASADYAAVKAKFDPKRGFPRAWIKAASTAELLQAANDLQAEHDDRRIWRYLQVFGIRDFPLSPRVLFHFVDSPNRRLSMPALRALQRLNHPDIRKLALSTISEGTRPAVAIRLLLSNFQPGDLKAVESMIQPLKLDDDTWHDVGMAVLDLLSRASVPEEESRGLLVRLYDENPCSLCRSSLVAKLFEVGNVPGWMTEEGEFDAEPEIVNLFKGAKPDAKATTV